MANEVIINIPGIGDVVAENAASEATLRDILSALGGRSGGGGSSGGSGSNSGTNANNDAIKSVKKFADNVDNAGKKIVDSIESLARLNGSVTAAANVVGDLARNIPLFGKTLQAAFGAVAVAQTDLIKSYQKSTEAGASFAGSLNDFVANASYAGLTLNEYGQFVAANGESLRLLSDNTEEGAKRFSVLSKVLRETSNDLFSLGYSTDDLNKGIVQYIQNQQYYGNINKKSNADLVTGTKAYLLELDTLAKVTGQSRDKIANDLATLNVDTEFRSFIDSLGAGSEKAGKELEETLGSVGPKMSSFMKDMITHGVPTTDENAAIMSVFPKLAAEALKYRQELQRGTANEDSRQRLMNTAAKESVANSKGWMNSVSGFADSGLKGARDLTSEGVKLSEDMRKSALDAQDKDLQSKENLIKSYSDFQKKITDVGNTFTNVLAHSGVFDTLTKMFTVLSETVGTVFTPMFNAFGASIKTITDQLSDWLTPALVSLRDLLTYIPSVLREAFSPLGELLKSKFGDILGIITGMADKSSFNAKEVATRLAEWIGTAVNTGYAYFLKFWNALEEVGVRIAIFATSFDDLELTIARLKVGFDSFLSMIGQGDVELERQHKQELADTRTKWQEKRDDRVELEEKLHTKLKAITAKYAEIDEDLKNLNSKVKENAQNVKPEGAAPAGQAAEEKKLQGEVAKTKEQMSTKGTAEGRKRLYKTDTGGTEVREGGTRAWRNKNPGNVRYGDYAKRHGAIGKDAEGFAMFASEETGEAARKNLIFNTKDYKDKTLTDAIAKYAPPSENDTAAYQAAVLKSVGGANKKMSDYSPAEQDMILAAMEKKEGYKAGKVTMVGEPGNIVSASQPTTNTSTTIPNSSTTKPELPTAEPAKPVAPETTKPELPTAEPAKPVPGSTEDLKNQRDQLKYSMINDEGEYKPYKDNKETYDKIQDLNHQITASYGSLNPPSGSGVNQAPLNNITSDKQARDEEFKKQQDDRVAAEAEAAEKQKQAGSNTTAGNNPVQGSDQNSDFFNGLLGSMNSIAKNTAEANDIGQQQVSATRGVSGNLYAH